MPTELTPEERAKNAVAESTNTRQDEGDLTETFKALSVEVSQICAAVTAERDRMASILETEIHAITSRNSAARFIGVSPLGLLTEILAAIRREPEAEK